MSIKKQIIKYLLLKIQNEEFLIGDKIPSENYLAIKFNCSRLTARSALLPLTHNGIIKLVPGIGNILQFSLNKNFDLKTRIVHHRSSIIKCSIDVLPISILKYLLDYNCCFELKYFFNNEIIAYSYVIFHNRIIKNLNKQSIFALFAKYQIVIKHVSSDLKTINNRVYNLPLKGQILVENKLTFYSEFNKIEAQVILFCNHHFYKKQCDQKIF